MAKIKKKLQVKKNGKKKKTGKIVKKKKSKPHSKKTKPQPKPRSPKLGSPENKMIEDFKDDKVDKFLEEHEEETKDLFL